MESLSRYCQAYDLFSAEKAQQKCTDAVAECTARRAELKTHMERAEQDKAAKKEEIARVLAKKTKDSGMKTLEEDERVCSPPHQLEFAPSC